MKTAHSRSLAPVTFPLFSVTLLVFAACGPESTIADSGGADEHRDAGNPADSPSQAKLVERDPHTQVEPVLFDRCEENSGSLKNSAGGAIALPTDCCLPIAEGRVCAYLNTRSARRQDFHYCGEMQVETDSSVPLCDGAEINLEPLWCFQEAVVGDCSPTALAVVRARDLYQSQLATYFTRRKDGRCVVDVVTMSSYTPETSVGQDCDMSLETCNEDFLLGVAGGCVEFRVAARCENFPTDWCDSD